MVTVSLLLSAVIIPVIIATAVFELAVQGTENAMKRAAHSISLKFHKPKQDVAPVKQ